VLTSVNWMNEYLDPPASAQEQAELLTRAGFPLEGSEALSGSDTRQDYEMTSNRGGCVCHLGLAREIAAISGRRLIPCETLPLVTGGPAREVITVTNREPGLCPLYTGRVIRGVTVGPSPEWLADRLRAIDQIPRNNIVDATNFVLFEMGQPTHVFDLAKLAGPRIIVRLAGQHFVSENIRAGLLFTYADKDATADFNSNQEYIIGGVVNIQYAPPMGLTNWPWRLDLPVLGILTNYQTPDPTIDPTVIRQDQEWRINVVNTFGFSREWSAFVQFGYSNNKSNLPNFTFDNISGVVGVTRSFF